MKAKRLVRTMAVVLVALVAGTSPSWSWEYIDWENDEGGGRYDFYAEKGAYGDNGKWHSWNVCDFKTLSTFSFEDDRFYWEYDFRVLNPNIYINNVALEGEILVVTSDGTYHKIGNWSKSQSSTSDPVGKQTDDKYGPFTISKVGDGHSMKVRFSPRQSAFDEGVKKIVFRSHILYNFSNQNIWDSGWMQYEKGIDLSSVFDAHKPIPDMNVEWTDDGTYMTFAKDMMDKRNNPLWACQRYGVDTYTSNGRSRYNNHNPYYHTSDFTFTVKGNGKMDVSRVEFLMKDNDSYRPYTTAVFFNYFASSTIYTDASHRSEYSLVQPSRTLLLKPFTHPKTVNVEFDKWNKRNTITWTRYEKVKYYNGGWPETDCRLDGTWYVVRYENSDAANYTVIGTFNGNANNLTLTDEDFDYEKEYVYRVIFLPDVLKNKFKDHLTDKFPGDDIGLKEAERLWKEVKVSTKLEMPIRLAQDRTYLDAVHLVWEYCVQPSGQNWTIEYSPAGENAWRVLDNSLTVDPDKSTASFDASGTVCDLIDYRVKTSYAGKEFYSNVISGSLPAGSYISEVKATTGTEEKTVIVKWKVERADMSNDIYYRVLRRQIGTEEWTLVNDDTHGTASEYTYTDDRVMAGSYYEYTVEAYAAKCEDQLVKTDEVIAPGFSQARGTITGHIAFGTGTAVRDVRVNLVKSSADESTDQPQFLSRYLEGEGKGLQWMADSAKYANVLNGSKKLTLQLWARPSGSGAAKMGLLNLPGALELGLKRIGDTSDYQLRMPATGAYKVTTVEQGIEANNDNTDADNTAVYQLYAIDLTTGTPKVKEFPSLTFVTTEFTHIAAVYDGTSKWTFYVGNDTLFTDEMTVANKQWNVINKVHDASSADNTLAAIGFGGTNRVSGNAFNGYVDDIRLWNRALDSRELSGNYTRILGGTEDGLMLYWPLDEGISIVQYAFDVARMDGIYQLNHPVVGVNAQPSAIVPNARYLALYGLTDQEGDYIIKGIPFQHGGTNYKLAPALGTHEFKPNVRSMFISPTSLTANNIDFEDVSSFPMSGYIYYAGTNIPAEGIQFYVDGDLVTANGEVQKTNSNGYYQISVPIGEHFVQAKLGGHKMVDGGRFPTTGNYDFKRAVQYDFADSTLVNFVGRIGGGERNDTLAVGFAESKNNIGMATVTLRLNNESFSFNCKDDHISDADTQRSWESDTVSINSRAWTGTGYDAKYIYIRTDSLTGEFSAMLPPLKYTTKSIRVDKNPDIEFTSLPEIDMTNALKEVKDSLKQATELGDSIWKYYKYNAKMIRAHYSQPIVELSQPGSDKGVFGMSEYKGEDVLGKFTVKDLWTKQDDGSITYKYGYPIYNMNDTYRMSIFGYERYTNYDSGQPVDYIIPMNKQVLTITNEMSADQKVVYAADESKSDYKPGQVYDLKSNQIALDSAGCYTMKWTTGAPNVTAPYTRHLGVTMTRKGRTYVPASLSAVVTGNLPMGNNFVTNGPDKLLMVLRDPPGAKSKTVWKRGTVTTTTETEANGGYGDEKFVYSTSAGVKTETHAGMGIITLTLDTENTFDTNDGIHYKWNKESSNEDTWAVTATQDISTGTSKDYCGSKGDVYIGVSTNLLMGQCRKVGFFRDSESAPFELKEKVAVSLGDSVTTHFMYSTYEIEEVMMPKWKETRNSYITQFFNTEAEARAFKNTTDEVIYATWLKKSDEDFGKKDTYIPVVPESWENKEYVEEDKVQWCNDQIESWRKALSDNEEDKVLAMANHDNWRRNISFDGGSSYTYTSKNDTTHTHKVSYSHNLGYMLKLGYSSKTEAFVTFKSTFSLDTENGWSHSESDSEKKYDYAEFDYIFDDGNKGTDFSVDIYKSPTGWSDVFSLFGGQSYNPYQGKEVTKYFEPGQHTLSNGTVRMEQPDIQISTDGEVAAKTATLTDVPAGQAGQFTLHLSNNSTTTQGFDFSYNIMVQEMADTLGLEILMDGVPAAGRSIFVPAGETVKKIITVRQTDQSILDYEGIEIWFISQYQPIKINDKCTLNVHFKPSSSPIQLAIADPVLNIETLGRNEGNLELKLTGFNRQFNGMTKVGVEYRYEGATQWTQPSELTFLVNRADSTKQGDQVLPATGDIRLKYNMKDDNLYPQGTYTFRAYTTTMYGTEPVNIYSSDVTVVKDNVRPRNLTTPLPANGILRYGDDLVVEFNEDIVPGYVSDKNIIVTAKLNDQPVQHDVAKILRPYGSKQMTMNPIFLNGDFSVDFWMTWSYQGTILCLGNGQFALSIDEAGHIVASMGGAQAVSKDVVPKNKWTYVVVSYKSSTKTFSALAQYDDKDLELFTDLKVDDTVVQQIHYSDDNRLYLGNMDGAMHDLSLFNIYRDVREAAATKNQTKDNYVYGLVNYWPMDEGHGYVANDTRHTHDFIVNNTWRLDNENYAMRLDKEMGVEADISRINTSTGDSYAIEMWINPTGIGKQNEQTIFQTGTTPSNQLRLYINQQKDWMLRYGKNEQVVVSGTDFPNVQGWNHIALNVVRGQAASFYFNGQRTAVITERDVPPMEGARLKLADAMGSFSFIDEVRIWHASLSESRLLYNMYNCIDTADVYARGLVAYYPFEKTGIVDGVTTKVSTLEDMAPRAINNLPPCSITPLGEHMLTRSTPQIKNAPEESRIIAKPIASERKIVIRLEEGSGIKARDIEGTTLNITADKIYDMHGNASEPIRWTTFVQLNTLKWTKDSVNIVKKYGDDYTLDVNIENRGGNTEYYTLYNMPQWLTLIDSERTDDVAPLSTKTLRFQVNPLVPVGNYDLTIGLQGNNQILEPLRLVMKVHGEKPAWSVDPSKYENTMNIVGQVYVNGILVGNSESRIAAFIGDECRGIAAPEEVRGAAYVTMTVFGNGDLDQQKPITFRIWDATTGVAYPDVNTSIEGSPVHITFDTDRLIGDFDKPLVWTKGNMIEQHIKLKKKWTWLSLSVQPEDSRPLTVFPDLTTWNTLIKSHTSEVYSTGAEWLGPLTIEVGQMYKVLLMKQLTNSRNLDNGITLKGQQVDLANTPITLRKNWNWIGYLPMTTMTPDEALAGANPQVGDRVKSQTAIAIYGPEGWEGNLKALESGQGYMYFNSSGEERQFVYPDKTLTAQRAYARSALSRAKEVSIFSPVDPYDYPDNMSMVIRLTDGEEVVDTAEVAAFIGGECRAATRADNGLYYLVIAGEGSGLPIELRTCINGEIRVIDSSLTYTSDANVGTPWEPYVIALNQADGISVVSGQPADASTFYDLLGRKLDTKPTRRGIYIERTANGGVKGKKAIGARR